MSRAATDCTPSTSNGKAVPIIKQYPATKPEINPIGMWWIYG